MGGQLEHTATVVVRIWTEAGSLSGPRARITSALDLSDPETHVIAVTSVDDLTEVIRAWFESFMALGTP